MFITPGGSPQKSLVVLQKGKVIWKYKHQKLGLISVLDEEAAFPVEVKAERIIGNV